MNKKDFDHEIARLETQWPQAYGNERRIVIFQAFRDVSQKDFHDAVSFCLAHCKYAPLLDDFQKALGQVAKGEPDGTWVMSPEQTQKYLARQAMEKPAKCLPEETKKFLAALRAGREWN